jgi:hypothetical protein
MTRLQGLLALMCGLLILTTLTTTQRASAQLTDRPTARIAILGALPPLTDAEDAEATAIVLKKEGYAPTILSPQQLADGNVFHTRAFDLLIVPHAETFPEMALPNLRTFLKARGRLLCIGAPAFIRFVRPDGDTWQLRPATEPYPPRVLLESLSPADKGVFVGIGPQASWQPIVRQRGLGLKNLRRGRPGRLLSVDPRGDEEGHGRESQRRQWAYLALSENGLIDSYHHTVWGGTVKPEYLGKATDTPLAPLVERLLQNVFLAYAGASSVCYFAEEAVVAGARVLNIGTKPQTVAGEIEVQAVGATSGVVNGLRTFEITVPAQNSEIPIFDFPELPPGEYRVRTTLFLSDGKKGDARPVLDRITGSFRVLPAKQQARPEESVQIKGRDFLLKGKPWRPMGVYYWPHWVAGQSSPLEWQRWLMPEYYDPQLVERDLETCAQIGINLLSVFYKSEAEGPALNDFLARCRNHRIKVNLILPNAASGPSVSSFGTSLLEAARLKGNPAVFALTPSYYMASNLKVTTVIADTRRIAETLRPYGFPVSLRFSVTPPFDIQMIATHLDFLNIPCPRRDSSALWQVREGRGTVEAQLPFVSVIDKRGAKPTLLDSFGYGTHAENEEKEVNLRIQADAYEAFLRKFQASQANGVVFWRYSGGMIYENTDFGIVGADGVPRPAARILQDFIKK